MVEHNRVFLSQSDYYIHLFIKTYYPPPPQTLNTYLFVSVHDFDSLYFNIIFNWNFFFSLRLLFMCIMREKFSYRYNKMHNGTLYNIHNTYTVRQYTHTLHVKMFIQQKNPFQFAAMCHFKHFSFITISVRNNLFSPQILWQPDLSCFRFNNSDN